MIGVLKSKVAIITGASQGLGFEIAKHYVAAGADIALNARDEALLENAKNELGELSSPSQKIIALPGDVSKTIAVNDIVQETVHTFGRIDILVNNAGIYGPKGRVEETDWQDWIQAIEINLYGSVLMCRSVVPFMKSQGHGKIVQISGGGATSPLPRISAYAASKAAIIRFMEGLAEEVRDDNIQVNAIAPGALNTRLLQDVLNAGPDAVGKDFYDRAVKQQQSGGTDPKLAAALAVYLASPSSDKITGKLISAQWDPWRTLGDHVEDLDASDIYTLRRITPKDRGKTWGNDQ